MLKSKMQSCKRSRSCDLNPAMSPKCHRVWKCSKTETGNRWRSFTGRRSYWQPYPTGQYQWWPGVI